MKAERRFLTQKPAFWAYVRSISQKIGYTKRGEHTIRVPTPQELADALAVLGLLSKHIISSDGALTPFGRDLIDYFQLRAAKLNDEARPNLMNKAQAKALFGRLKKSCKIKFVVPMNKQKGDKSGAAYLTGIVNILIAKTIDCHDCDYSPRQLTTFTKDGLAVATLARWVDGAFPSTVNPLAVWEIKEYYNTKTFGSRVADGVYESLLDGMELRELAPPPLNIHCQHFLIVDDHFTWWECGRSYLCRIFDMLHMGFVDEVLFGREVVERIPKIFADLLEVARKQNRGPENSGPR
jgi:hypothetical protein